MNRHLVALAALVALAGMPGEAQAQRRGGSVITPYGELYDTRSPEYRQSGGNPYRLQELLEQKEMRQQYQAMQQMQKQQQAYQKQVQDYLKKHPEVKKQYEDEQKRLMERELARPKADPKKPPVRAKVKPRGNGKAAAKSDESPATAAPDATTPEAKPAEPKAKATGPGRSTLSGSRAS